MIKQQLTPERLIRVQFSLQKQAILAKMLLLENQTEIDADFRVPYINNFAKRISGDCKTILEHLHRSGRMIVKVKDNDFYEDYAGELWRVVNMLAGLDIDILQAFADNLEVEFKKIEV